MSLPFFEIFEILLRYFPVFEADVSRFLIYWACYWWNHSFWSQQSWDFMSRSNDIPTAYARTVHNSTKHPPTHNATQNPGPYIQEIESISNWQLESRSANLTSSNQTKTHPVYLKKHTELCLFFVPSPRLSPLDYLKKSQNEVTFHDLKTLNVFENGCACPPGATIGEPLSSWVYSPQPANTEYISYYETETMHSCLSQVKHVSFFISNVHSSTG